MTPTAFFALWPSASIAATLHAWASELRGQTKARVMREESLHVTLAYVGRVSEADLGRLVEAGGRVRLARHELILDHVDYWPQNGVLWAGPAHTPARLLELVDDLRGALREAGFSVDPRPFAPHVTLLRRANPKSSRATSDGPAFAPLVWSVDGFVLARSDPSPSPLSTSSARRPGGTEYRVVERFAAVGPSHGGATAASSSRGSTPRREADGRDRTE